jgi:hypothetical protein
MLKYGLSYYEKKFNFQIDITENKENILIIHNYNKDVFTKGIRLNKDYISIELGKIRMLDGYKYNSKSINHFLSNENMKDNELASDFLIRYHAKTDECEIFNDMLDIVFNSHMTRLSTSIVFFKIIRDNYKGEMPNTTKKTKKAHIKFSRKLTKKISNST